MISIPNNTVCQIHYNKVVEFAEKAGLFDKFQEALDYLANYANGPGCSYDRLTGADTQCVLYPDFAPHSFAVVMKKMKPGDADWTYWFIGGLIYQGPDVPADGSFPSLTVSVDSTKVGWFLHT